MRHGIIAAVAAAFSLCSCMREPIYDDRSDYRIEISPAYDMLYNKPDVAPALFKVCFYDPDTHRLVSSSTVGGKGGYLYNLKPGEYDVVIYDYTANRTRVANEDSKDMINASTSALSYREFPVVESPDHLFVQRFERLKVPYLSERDPEWVLRSEPSSVVDSWCLVIEGIKGLQNADVIDVYVTGQSDVLHFGRDEARLGSRDVAIWFPAVCDYDKGIILTPFNTFGKISGSLAKLTLNLYVVGVGGDTYTCRADVTDQFDDPLNVEHVIRAEFDITINERKDGGMAPVVDPWNPNIDDIELK